MTKTTARNITVGSRLILVDLFGAERPWIVIAADDEAVTIMNADNEARTVTRDYLSTGAA